MNFTKDSRELMKYFLKHFDKYGIDKLSQEQNKNDVIFKSIYNDIKLSRSYVNRLNRLNLINKNVKEIITKKDFPKCSLFNNKYIPKYINNFIIENTHGYFKASVTINSMNINIYLLLFSEKDYYNFTVIEKKLDMF